MAENESSTRINNVIFTAIVTAIFGIQAWSLVEIINLKIAVAEIRVELTHHLADNSIKP
jgi:hypothetical protein